MCLAPGVTPELTPFRSRFAEAYVAMRLLIAKWIEIETKEI